MRLNSLFKMCSWKRTNRARLLCVLFSALRIRSVCKTVCLKTEHWKLQVSLNSHGTHSLRLLRLLRLSLFRVLCCNWKRQQQQLRKRQRRETNWKCAQAAALLKHPTARPFNAAHSRSRSPASSLLHLHMSVLVRRLSVFPSGWLFGCGFSAASCQLIFQMTQVNCVGPGPLSKVKMHGQSHNARRIH